MSVLFWSLILLCLHGAIDVFGIAPDVLEDASLNPFELLMKYGYPGETHKVTTPDNYILTVHRIPRPGAIPVLLVHGLFDTSATWLMMGPDKGLGYMLYDAGYDVWMANCRGNTYAKEHKIYKVFEERFWDFTFHEMGIYDLPSTIDYALNNTGFSQLHYIGHSQGTLSFWIMGSERPDYMEKIILMQAMAPIAYFKNTWSPIILFLGTTRFTSILLNDLMGSSEFLPNERLTSMFNEQLCGAPITRTVCESWLFIMLGFDEKQLNQTMLPVIMGHAPAGASTKQIIHFGQIRSLGGMHQFDYGMLDNLRRYGSISPPKYNFKNVTAKVGLNYGQNDLMAAVKDVRLLRDELPNVIDDNLIDYRWWNHLDFIWAIDAKELLWNRMLDHMQTYDKDVKS
ncbi:lipase 3-like [Drosophila nasuta]|uniref:lipase 3-like n=1 Tax=Drosophila nasuta TaxID=42062 RepID=UPI00295EFD92|nr:lipase 3-like [Drosophila nasuta]